MRLAKKDLVENCRQVFEKTSDLRNLPPHHDDGRTLEEAFVFDELCPTFHQERLPTVAFLTASISDHDRMEMHAKGESGFVMKQMAKLKDMDETEQHCMALRLCFLSALLKVHRLQRQIRRTAKKRLHQFAESHGIDPPLLEYLLSVFFEERSELVYRNGCMIGWIL